MTQYTVMLNKYSKLMTVIYKTIVTQKKNDLQTLKLSKLVLILHYVCYKSNQSYNYLSNDFSLS